MKKNTIVTIEYAAAQALYWMKYAVIVSFAAVYLQALSCSNMELGIMFGLGYALGFGVSNLFGNWVDRFEKLDAGKLVNYILIGEAALTAVLFAFSKRNAFTIIVYAVYICLCMCVSGLMTKQWTDLTHNGFDVDFGLTRAAGSVGYMLMAALVGVAVEKLGVKVLLPTALASVALEGIDNCLLMRSMGGRANGGRAFVKGQPFFAFARDNKLFCLLLLGLTFIFFSYRLPSDYMINLVGSVGGNAADMGVLHSFNAAVELPAMLLYRRIGRKLSVLKMMIVSLAMFTVKAGMYTFAGSMTGLFVAAFFQCVSFALYTPAVVDYVKDTVSYENSAKGQTMVYSVSVLSSVFSSFLGGMMLDSMPMKRVMLISTGISAAGTAICIAALLAARKEQNARMLQQR